MVKVTEPWWLRGRSDAMYRVLILRFGEGSIPVTGKL
jgi:hypothetical protein